MRATPTRRWVTIGAAVGLALAVAACDDDAGSSGLLDQDATTSPDLVEGSDGAGGDTSAPAGDVASEADATPEPADTAQAEDTSATTDTAQPADTATAADTTTTTDTATTADAVAPACEAASCPPAVPGPIGVTITYHGATVLPPSLSGVATGADAPTGAHDLVAVDIYPTDAISALLTVNITDNYDADEGRGSNGTITFEGGLWSIFLGLDLRFQASAIGQNFDEEVEQDLDAGGCFTIAANAIESDLSLCAQDWPENIDLPESAEFSYSASGEFKLKLVLTKEFLLSFVPAEYASLAGLLITGDLVLVATAQQQQQ